MAGRDPQTTGLPPRPPVDFDPRVPETFTSAHESYDELRARCPVAYSDAWNGFWALLRYDDVEAVLRDHGTFITSVQNVVPRLAFTGRRPPLHLDPPEHTPYRQAMNPFFTTEKMTALEPELRRVTVELLRPLIERGGGDACEEFSYALPGHVFARFFNVSTRLSLRIRDVTKAYAFAVQEMHDELVKETSLELYEIAREIIAMRKAEPLDPQDDPTSALLAARDANGDLLPEEMVLGTVRQFIVVGMIAPSVFIGAMIVHLAENGDVQDALRRDPSLVPAAVEEYLRLLTPYRGFARTATRDVEIGGRLIREAEPIALVYAAANRDPAIFPDPHRFLLDRPNVKRHLAFGLGPHRCAGAPLATLMLKVTLEELLAKTSRIELAGEVRMTRWPEWGTLSVPVQLTPA